MEINSEQLQAMTTADISSTLMLLKNYPTTVLEPEYVENETGHRTRKSTLIITRLQEELNKRLNNIFIF